MISKTVDIGYGWKVRMRCLKDGSMEFSRYRNKSHPEAIKSEQEYDFVQIFDDGNAKALTEFWKFIEEIKGSK